MSNQNLVSDDTIRQQDISTSLKTGLKAQIFTHRDSNSHLELKKDYSPNCGIIQTGCGIIPVSATRDATEGRTMSGHGLQFGLRQQTTFVAGHGVQGGDRTKSININLTADKFLLGTMDAMSYTEGTSTSTSSDSATSVDILKYGPEATLMDTENAVEYSNFGPKNIQSDGFSYGFESTCSPQKKTKPNPRTSRPPLLPPCRVCNDRASGYHYGVNTCEACKGFFRRSICKTEPYVCTGSGECKTVAGKRTACSHCRFKRCIAVGMSKNAIKTGRYTHELRSKNILEVKRLQKQASDESPDRSSVDSFNSDANYTEYKNDLLKKTVLEETLEVLISGQKFLYEFLDDYYNEDLIKERQISVYRSYMDRKRILLQQSGSLARQSEVQFADNSHHISQTKLQTASDDISTSQTGHHRIQNSISVTAQVEQKHSTPLNRGLADDRVAKTEDDTRIKPEDSVLPPTESIRAEVMTKIIHDLEQGVQGMLAFAKSLPGFAELPAPDQVSLVKAARFDIWYLGHIRCFNVELRVGACEWQFHAEELAQVWGDSMVELAFTLSRVAQTLHLTKNETAALRAVCLTFPDRCTDLQNRHEVEQMHEQILDVFKFVSCKRHSDFNKWFPKVINFLVLLREFGIKFEAVSSKLTLDWSVLKDNPVLLSVFLS